jgi:hypothetical protein
MKHRFCLISGPIFSLSIFGFPDCCMIKKICLDSRVYRPLWPTQILANFRTEMKHTNAWNVRKKYLHVEYNSPILRYGLTHVCMSRHDQTFIEAQEENQSEKQGILRKKCKTKNLQVAPLGGIFSVIYFELRRPRLNCRVQHIYRLPRQRVKWRPTSPIPSNLPTNML